MRSSEYNAREMPAGSVQRADRMPHIGHTLDYYAAGQAPEAHRYIETAFHPPGERHLPIAGSSLQSPFPRTFRYSDPTGLLRPPWNLPTHESIHARSPIDSRSITYDVDWSPVHDASFEDSSTVGE